MFGKSLTVREVNKQESEHFKTREGGKILFKAAENIKFHEYANFDISSFIGYHTNLKNTQPCYTRCGYKITGLV
jgi:hypothetical protein